VKILCEPVAVSGESLHIKPLDRFSIGEGVQKTESRKPEDLVQDRPCTTWIWSDGKEKEESRAVFLFVCKTSESKQ